MTWKIAAFLAVVSTFAAGLVGAIAAMIGLKIHDALASTLRRMFR